MIIDPSKAKTKDFHQFLIGSVAPRPIAFVSTVDENGVPNIAPYSFFNAYSSNPPVLVFSSNRRVLNNTTKDTLHNIQTTKEVVVNMVNFDIVRQMALASVEFDSDISEFDKSGLTPIPAVKVKPSLIKESPVKLECKVKEIITLGEHGGAGHLIICDVVMMHIDDRVVDNGRINPHKIDLVGRLGRFHYVRASGDAIFDVVQLVTKIVIGWDALPKHIVNSSVLSGNEISLLAGCEQLPEEVEVAEFIASDKGQAFVSMTSVEEQHYSIKKVLADRNQALLMAVAISK